MKVLISLFLVILLAGCATSPREVNIRSIAVQTFGNDRNLTIHEVVYLKPHLYGGIAGSYDSSDDYGSLANEMRPGEIRDRNLVVWGASSAWTANVVLATLNSYASTTKLQHLRLLFIGDLKDAERIRPVIEARGAQFFAYSGNS
jgi:hypothetical protein